jgi:t-SNARE complex subunit (syntaxin)
MPINTGEKTASFIESEKELTDTLKDDNLTAVQKIIIKHAISDLKQAQATEKKAVELEKKVVASAEKAGAGKLIYTIIYFVAFLIVAFIGFKIMRKFSFF